MGANKPVWLSDDTISLAEKKQRLKREYPHIVRQLRDEVEREMRKKFHESAEEQIKARLKALAGI